MKKSLLCLAVVLAGSAVAKAPPVRTGTNTTRESSQPVQSTGGALDQRTEIAPTDQALVLGRKMAACAVKRQPERVRTVLSVDGEAEFKVAVEKLNRALSDCMMNNAPDVTTEARFQFSGHALAGLLAEASLATQRFPVPTAVTYDQNKPQLDWIATSQASLIQLRLAECLAHRHPSHLAPFVTATPASPEELAAFRALMPLISTCLDKNVTLQAKRNTLKLAMAFALYRQSAISTFGSAAK